MLSVGHIVCKATPPDGYHPVVFAGPLIGQTLETRFHSSLLCGSGEWKGLWLGDEFFKVVSEGVTYHPTFVHCLLEGLSLAGFTEHNTSIPDPNVDVRATLTEFDKAIFGGKWTAKLVEAGYEVGTSIGFQAYDWRLSVKDWQQTVFPEFKQQVEELVSKAGGSPAVLSGNSMAGPFTHAFLAWTRTQDKSWTKKFVHAFVPVGGPWDGSVQDLLGTLSSILGTYSTFGECPACKPFPEKAEPLEKDDTQNRMFSDLIGVATNLLDAAVSQAAWTWPVMYWMSPGVDYSHGTTSSKKVVNFQHGRTPPQCLGETSTRCGDAFTRSGWYLDDPKYVEETECAECHKVASGSKCRDGFDRADDNWITDLCCKRHKCDASAYTAAELPELFHKLNRESSARMMSYAQSVHTTADPGVPVHCIYGHNIKTHSRLSFMHETKLDDLLVTFADGDAVVHQESLEVCDHWPSTQKVYKIPGLKHGGGAYNCDDIAELILSIATNDDAAWKAWTSPTYETVRADNGSLASVQELFHKPATFIDRLVQLVV